MMKGKLPKRRKTRPGDKRNAPEIARRMPSARVSLATAPNETILITSEKGTSAGKLNQMDVHSDIHY